VILRPLFFSPLPLAGKVAAQRRVRVIRPAMSDVPRMTNIFLVGPMGSGKSAVGRQLAQRLGLTFVDSDEEIEARTGVDIAYIFEREGETGFRQREAEVIDALTARDGLLLSTGGGAILDPGTRERLRARGRVVYLRTTVDQQLARTRRSNDRPLLNNDDPRGTLDRLFQQRAPLYLEVAEFVVDTDGRKVKTVVDMICRELDAQGTDRGTAQGTAQGTAK
jgi:shikimate kinase